MLFLSVSVSLSLRDTFCSCKMAVYHKHTHDSKQKELVNADARQKFKNTIVAMLHSVQWSEDDRFNSLIPVKCE